MSTKLNIGLFGFGCVGSGLYKVLHETQQVKANIARIVVKDKTKSRSIAPALYGFNKAEILENPSINLVVELIDDADAAYDIVTEALRKKKHVVSANKKLIAEHLDELITLAKANGVSFLYEAAVCASIPVIRNIEEYYTSDVLSRLEGVFNGTSNYILTQTDAGKTYDEALQEASDLGYAESDPTLDVDAFDAKFKLCILVKHAFGLTLQPQDVFNYGIRHIKPRDVVYAKEKGLKVKLLAKAVKLNDKLLAYVAPHFIPANHNCYAIDNALNGVTVEGLFSDEQLFKGQGAGSLPTASAVLSDISALLYDYQYEYKKSNVLTDLSLTQNFKVKVYIGATDAQRIERLPFLEVEENYQSAAYYYKTGWIRFEDLLPLNLNAAADLFVAVLPENEVELVSLPKAEALNYA
ncbi:homoserine dehydrogenase [Lishizhenia sp.]|uniref:homoserine dehydrogenase n=1 Tax=Lishizhenia sp. TaxID=2497594 RepID=UPI00299D5E83|nr:homoserine dehydrogenase [Lishizhenia sp.]MDX1447188.1 homoserine dehydrogenase [Lishizhenia sp.]